MVLSYGRSINSVDWNSKKSGEPGWVWFFEIISKK